LDWHYYRHFRGDERGHFGGDHLLCAGGIICETEGLKGFHVRPVFNQFHLTLFGTPELERGGSFVVGCIRGKNEEITPFYTISHTNSFGNELKCSCLYDLSYK